MNPMTGPAANRPPACDAAHRAPQMPEGFPSIRPETASGSQRPPDISRKPNWLESYELVSRSHSGKEGRLAWSNSHGLACLLRNFEPGHQACHERIRDFGWMTEFPPMSDNRYIKKTEKEIESAYKNIIFYIEQEMEENPYDAAELAAEATVMLCSSRVKCYDPPIETREICESLFLDTLRLAGRQTENVKDLFLKKLLCKDMLSCKKYTSELTPRPILIDFASNGKFRNSDLGVCGQAKNENIKNFWVFVRSMSSVDSVTKEIYKVLYQNYRKEDIDKTCSNIGTSSVL